MSRYWRRLLYHLNAKTDGTTNNKIIGPYRETQQMKMAKK